MERTSLHVYDNGSVTTQRYWDEVLEPYYTLVVYGMDLTFYAQTRLLVHNEQISFKFP